MLKFEKTIGFKSASPNQNNVDKYESFNMKGNMSTPDNHNHSKPPSQNKN